MKEKLTAMGIDPWPGTPEELDRLVRTETARYAAVIKSIRLKRDWPSSKRMR
jgi:tripartite-type tricarboxylate transporter receptor subunit TctC